MVWWLDVGDFHYHIEWREKINENVFHLWILKPPTGVLNAAVSSPENCLFVVHILQAACVGIIVLFFTSLHKSETILPEFSRCIFCHLTFTALCYFRLSSNRPPKVTSRRGGYRSCLSENTFHMLSHSLVKKCRNKKNEVKRTGNMEIIVVRQKVTENFVDNLIDSSYSLILSVKASDVIFGKLFDGNFDNIWNFCNLKEKTSKL